MNTEAEVGQSFNFAGVPREVVGVMADRLKPLIERALEKSRGEYTADDILSFAASGDMQVWIAGEGSEIEAVMVTQIVKYPRKTFLRIVTLAGRHVKRFKFVMDVIERWAITKGCEGTEAFTMPSVRRLFREYGYRTFYEVAGVDFNSTSLH